MEGGVVDKEAPEQGKEQFQTPPQYGASIQEQLTTLAKQEEEQAEKSEEADLALFREFWKEEEEHAKKNTDETAEKAAAWLQAGVNDIFTKSSSAMDALRREKVEKFESLLEKRRQNRVARQDSRRKVFLELVQKHLVAKKDMQTEQKIRRNRLENAQQIPLADRFDDENVFGSLQFTNGGANVADVDLHFAATHDTEETEEVPAFFDKDLPAKDVPPIKSVRLFEPQMLSPRPHTHIFSSSTVVGFQDTSSQTDAFWTICRKHSEKETGFVREREPGQILHAPQPGRQERLVQRQGAPKIQRGCRGHAGLQGLAPLPRCRVHQEIRSELRDLARRSRCRHPNPLCGPCGEYSWRIGPQKAPPIVHDHFQKVQTIVPQTR